MTIFIWALLNFIGVTIEDIGKSIGKSKQYRKMQDTYLSLEASRRLHCILTSPLLAMSAISNFYFFAGQEIGDIFIQNILHGKFITFLHNSLIFEKRSIVSMIFLLYIAHAIDKYDIMYNNCTNDLKLVK